MIKNIPKVSIGVPVYNAEKYLRKTLDALVSQSFSNIEIIISDNFSADDSQDICLEYSEKHSRIKYFRQTKNIGGWENFKFVLNQSEGEYFMWSAADDLRSLDFVELNYNFLSLNVDYVASTCPNKFERGIQEISFGLNDDNVFKRYVQFFDHCWFSHGIFYSLIRIDTLKECPLLKEGDVYFGIDWVIDIFLASKGKINLTDKGHTLFNDEEGESKRPDHHKRVRVSYIENFIPFYKLSFFVVNLTNSLVLIERIKIINLLIKLNFKVIYDRSRSNLKNLLIYFKLMQVK